MVKKSNKIFLYKKSSKQKYKISLLESGYKNFYKISIFSFIIIFAFFVLPDSVKILKKKF